MKFNYAAFLKSDTRYQISKVTNCVSMDTHFGDACLIWQLAQLRVHGHALWRCLPYLATHPTACPWTRTSEILALVGNSPNCVSMDTHFGDPISEMQSCPLHKLRRPTEKCSLSEKCSLCDQRAIRPTVSDRTVAGRW